jgi:hypothetical protein
VVVRNQEEWSVVSQVDFEVWTTTEGFFCWEGPQGCVEESSEHEQPVIVTSSTRTTTNLTVIEMWVFLLPGYLFILPTSIPYTHLASNFRYFAAATAPGGMPRADDIEREREREEKIHEMFICNNHQRE